MACRALAADVDWVMTYAGSGTHLQVAEHDAPRAREIVVVRERRVSLLSAALTILRAYFVAGSDAEAVVAGDVAMRANEVTPVLKALRSLLRRRAWVARPPERETPRASKGVGGRERRSFAPVGEAFGS